MGPGDHPIYDLINKLANVRPCRSWYGHRSPCRRGSRATRRAGAVGIRSPLLVAWCYTQDASEPRGHKRTSLAIGKTVGVDAPFPTRNVYVTVQGNCAEIHKRQSWSAVPKHTKRGVVTDFSSQARMRMLRMMNKVDWQTSGDGVFVTLTYPDTHRISTNKERTYHRNQFLKGIEYHLGRKVSTFWRIEWKERMTGANVGEPAAHMHFACLGVRFIDIWLIDRVWRNVLNVTDHLVTHVRRITGHDGMCRYLTKYVTKYCSLDDGTYLNNSWMQGRHWGYTRKDLIPFSPQTVNRKATPLEIKLLDALGADQFEHYGKCFNGSFTLLTPNLIDTVLLILGE